MEIDDFDEVFKDILDLKDYISKLHQNNGRQHRNSSSKPGKHLQCKCPIPNCYFHLYYGFSNSEDYRLNRKSFKNHTCTVNPLRKNSHSHTRFYQNIIRENPLKGPITIFNEINQNSDQQKVNYDTIRKEMSKIKKDILTDLMKLEAIMKVEDSQSKLEIIYNDIGEFNGLFFADKSFLSSIYYAKRVIFLDASHLSGTQRGLVYIASTLDSDNSIIYIGLYIYKTEDQLGWTTFLTYLKKYYPILSADSYYCVSDRCKGLMNAVQTVFPNFQSQHCSYHICQNLYCSKLGMDEDVERIFYLAASSLSITEHNSYMEEIKTANIKVFDYLNRIDKNRWAICYSKVPTYGYSASSVAESTKACLRL